VNTEAWLLAVVLAFSPASCHLPGGAVARPAGVNLPVAAAAPAAGHLAAASVARGAPAEAPRALDDCNVVFDTPSANASGAVPIGNGEVGASVWIEPNGDVLLYLARPDSFSEACRLLKIGKMRVSFQPARSTEFGSFRQELRLRQGRLEADIDDIHLEAFVQPDRPVLRIIARSVRPCSVRVTYEGWRRQRRVLNGTPELDNSGWTMRGGPASIPVVESADVVLAADRTPSALVWYHHNGESVVPATLRHQSCDRIAGGFDPLLYRIFGAWIEGPGLRREGAEALVSSAPATALDLRIACPTLISTNADRWLERASKDARDAPQPPAARAATETWWQAFWARSWVFVHQPIVREGGDPLRVGGDEAEGRRFAGEFGRVGVYGRALGAAEIARLAAGGPSDAAAVAADRVMSAAAPRAGQAWPEHAATDLAHGFTLEAWVRPARGAPGRFFDRAAGTGGFVFDTPDGGDLRLTAGKVSICPPSIACTSKAAASHSFNTLSALNNQDDVRSSHDLAVERFTWWDHRGTKEWVQYEFRSPAAVDGVEVYWFDDTALGGACRTPRSWTVLYLDGERRWQPVVGDGRYPTKLDTYNSVSFSPVRTSALRIEVQLEAGYSGGILEWRVREADAKKLLVPGRWQHVAATCGPQGTMTLYHNGRMAAHRGQTGATSISQAYALQRFVTACQARGEAPIKFNGGIFTVEPQICNPKLTGSPDWRLWGDGYWYQNTRHMYHPMLAAGDFDLMAPLFALYERSLPLARARAKAWYGADGAFFPETMSVFGTYPNGDYGWDRTNRKPGDVWCTAWKYAWNQGPELVDLMLDRWDYTGDREFLRGELMPMADAVLRYFDTRFRKEDGRIVLDPTQAVETFRTGVLDDMPTVAGLRSITVRSCALADDLVTPGERAFFAHMRDACPPVPTEVKTVNGVKQTSLAPARTYMLEGWNCENADLYAVWPLRLYGMGRPDLEVARTAYRTRRYSVDNGWGYDGNAAALLGLADEAARVLTGRCRNSHPAYRFPATWGPNYDWLPDQNHGGNLMEMAQLMLIQPVGRRILLLPAWPPRWDVSFRLHAPQRTVVEGEVRGGKLARLAVAPASRRADIEICPPFAADAPRQATPAEGK
jgi:hypothetical protein